LHPYLPDYNPIELGCLAMKYHLCRKGYHACLAMTELSEIDIMCILLEALYESMPDDIFRWFRHCRYV
jgi:transposase